MLSILQSRDFVNYPNEHDDTAPVVLKQHLCNSKTHIKMLPTGFGAAQIWPRMALTAWDWQAGSHDFETAAFRPT